MKVFHIPTGPKNLATLFPAVDFDQVATYRVLVKDGGGATIATTPMNNMVDGECCDDKIRIRFLNSQGTIDAVNFKIVNREQETKSESFQRRTTHPLNKAGHSIGRFNIKANDTLILNNSDYGEEDQDWLAELLRSPLAWMEWTGIQGQADSYIPVVIQDEKHTTRKEKDRFVYDLTLTVKLSHEKFILRN